MAGTSKSGTNLDFIVRRDDLRTYEFMPDDGRRVLAPGQVLLRVDRFAFTSNNVTYAAFGEAMSYWNFFPAPAGWGRVPVWGFGSAVESLHDAVKPGERFYGYYPMSSRLVVEPERANESGFFDGVAHRKPLHAVYNQYLRTGTDPGYDPAREDEQMLLRPLFVTSFLIDDFLADNAFFSAEAIVLSSASSKTAYGTAFQLSQRGSSGRPEIIGLTSPGNKAFVERLGCYDRVLAYADVNALPAERPAVYVDMAGDGTVRSALHHRFGDSLKHSCAVGGTHWDALTGASGLPGPRPALFFAPAQIKKRIADWGTAEVQRRIAVAWRVFLAKVAAPSGGWMKVIHGRGPADVERVYLDMLEGRARPEEGHVLSL